MKALTLKDLQAIVNDGVKRGFGDKVVLLSDDDEGNGYHTLFYGLTTKTEAISDIMKYADCHDGQDAKDVVILG